MMIWIKEYKWWIVAGIILTIETIKYEYERRGSLEFGSEYALIFLPVFVHIIKYLWNDSKEMLDETLSEGWIDR